ncbi:hypothetical protein, partial [Nitrospirillum amazonense]|uniref:hypothetical protein n=1 Tax=Nitrospirillum amazonense TaxID=28077 RepID=UPI0024123986
MKLENSLTPVALRFLRIGSAPAIRNLILQIIMGSAIEHLSAFLNLPDLSLPLFASAIPWETPGKALITKESRTSFLSPPP